MAFTRALALFNEQMRSFLIDDKVREADQMMQLYQQSGIETSPFF